jgi:hypothetical protein
MTLGTRMSRYVLNRDRTRVRFKTDRTLYVSTTLNVYSHLLKEVHAEQAQKLDVILGFAEQPGNSSESVRTLLEDFPKINRKGVTAFAVTP